jgi:deoxyribose-phosphate aldolase
MISDKDIAKRALSCLDLTDLSDDCAAVDIRQLCKKAVTPYGKVAAICIWPKFISDAVGLLKDSGVKIATVVNFPQGDHAIGGVLDMTEQAVKDGADEIDMVIPWKLLLEGHPENVDARVARVCKAAGSAKVKAIIESGMLPDSKTIALATHAAIDGGAHFVKTSTGKVSVSATPDAARTMLTEIKASKQPVGFKAAGGIRTLDDARTYLNIADEIMGADWASPDTFRFGASGVLDALLATIEGRDTPQAGQGY